MIKNDSKWILCQFYCAACSSLCRVFLIRRHDSLCSSRFWPLFFKFVGSTESSVYRDTLLKRWNSNALCLRLLWIQSLLESFGSCRVCYIADFIAISTSYLCLSFSLSFLLSSSLPPFPTHSSKTHFVRFKITFNCLMSTICSDTKQTTNKLQSGLLLWQRAINWPF